MQSAYLRVIFHVKHKKITISLILGKTKMTTLLVTSQASSSATTYKTYLILLNIKGFELKVKSFQNTAKYQKLRGGVPSTPSPPPLVPR